MLCVFFLGNKSMAHLDYVQMISEIWCLRFQEGMFHDDLLQSRSNLALGDMLLKRSLMFLSLFIIFSHPFSEPLVTLLKHTSDIIVHC